jgi:hypothetical protein
LAGIGAYRIIRSKATQIRRSKDVKSSTGTLGETVSRALAGGSFRDRALPAAAPQHLPPAQPLIQASQSTPRNPTRAFTLTQLDSLAKSQDSHSFFDLPFDINAVSPHMMNAQARRVYEHRLHARRLRDSVRLGRLRRGVTWKDSIIPEAISNFLAIRSLRHAGQPYPLLADPNEIGGQCSNCQSLLVTRDVSIISLTSTYTLYLAFHTESLNFASGIYLKSVLHCP